MEMHALTDAAAIRKVSLFVAVIMSAVGILLSVAVPASAADAPENDDVENAEILRGDTASVVGDNEFAAREGGERDHIRSGASLGERSVWYRWTAWKSGSFKADVCRSDFDNVVAVYTQDDGGDFDKVADNDDACFSPNVRGGSVVFDAKLEKTYWISVASYSEESSGEFTLRLRPHPRG